jgi:hypothetical protein
LEEANQSRGGGRKPKVGSHEVILRSNSFAPNLYEYELHYIRLVHICIVPATLDLSKSKGRSQWLNL